ncbi:MAG: FkbM family methyltransferase [Limibaculum sp.]
MTTLRGWLKSWLPRPVWVLLRRTWNYARRLGYWALVLIEVRGDGAREALKLYLSALAAPVTALRELDEWGNPALLFDTWVRVDGSYRFHCRRASDDLWVVVPSGQGAVRKALVKRLKPGGVFVDAGAHIGAITVLGARLVGSHGRVVAIEMVPDTARRLRDHLELNGLGWVSVVEGALSDIGGQDIVAKMPPGLAGQASIVRTAFAKDEFIEVHVKTTTLDHVVEDLPRLDVLKVDLEGAEALAFDGGRETLSRTRCVIFEDWVGRGHGREAAERVAGAGFELRRLDGINMIGVR